MSEAFSKAEGRLMKASGLVAVVVLLFIGPGQANADIIYDPAASFSTTNNPNGVWRYGWSQTLGSAFTLDTFFQRLDGILPEWGGNLTRDGNPGIYHNDTGSAQTVATLTMPAGSLAEHPGVGGQYALLRFTAPSSGTYSIAGSFSGFDFAGPTTTDVHVLVDGVSRFDGAIVGFGPDSAAPFRVNLPLVSGETVDFAVGTGSDGSFAFDMTGLATRVTQVIPPQAVPEPVSLGPFGVGSRVLLGYAWRPRRRPI